MEAQRAEKKLLRQATLLTGRYVASLPIKECKG